MTLRGVERSKIGRRLLWVAATGPFLYQLPTSLGVAYRFDPSDVLRVAATVIPLFLALAVSPPQRFRLGVPEFATVTFGLLAVVSALWSTDPTATLLRASFYLLAIGPILLLPNYYASMAEFIQGFQVLLRNWVLLATVQVVVFRAEVFAGPASIGGVERARSLVPSLSSYSLGLVACLLIVGYSAGVGPIRPRSRWARIVLIAICVVTIVMLTRTRSALLVLLVVVAGTAVVVARRNRAMAALLPVLPAIVGVIVVTLGPQLEQLFLRGETRGGLLDLTGRVSVWSTALDAIGLSWITGGGYFVSQRAIGVGTSGLALRSNLDNTWLEAAADLGLVGVGILGLAVLAGIMRAWRLSQRDRYRSFVLVGLAVLVMASFLSPTLQSPGANQAMLLCLMVAPLASAVNGKSAYRPTEDSLGGRRP